MKVKYIRLVPISIAPIGNYRSLPAEIGTACPLRPYQKPRSMEYPQSMSNTAEWKIPSMEPSNDSILAIAYPLESSPDQAD